MKRDELELLHRLDEEDGSSEILARKPSTAQQRFLLSVVNIVLLNKGIETEQAKSLLESAQGSFTNLLLSYRYASNLLEQGEKAQYDHIVLIDLLTQWLEVQTTLKKADKFSLMGSLFGQRFETDFNGQFELIIVYLNYVANDVVKLIKRKLDADAPANKFSVSHLDTEDLFEFLLSVTPKICFNVLKVQGEKQKQKPRRKEYLYINESTEYFANSHPNYQYLLRLVIRVLLSFELKPKQLKQLMEVAFRYFLLFENSEQAAGTQTFLLVFAKLTEAVKYALSDEFLMFLRICKKVGCAEFVEQLSAHSEWIKGLLPKIQESTVIGNPVDSLQPFNPLSVSPRVWVEHGKSVAVTVQVFHEESLIYYQFEIESMDVTVRLYYLGDFESKMEIRKLVNSWEKQTGKAYKTLFCKNRGIYEFEFDNSFSWINNKTVRFDYVVLANYQHTCNVYPTWMDELYAVTPSHHLIKSKESIETQPKDRTATRSQSDQYERIKPTKDESAQKNPKIVGGSSKVIAKDRLIDSYEFEGELKQSATQKVQKPVERKESQSQKVLKQAEREEECKPIKITKKAQQQQQSRKRQVAVKAGEQQPSETLSDLAKKAPKKKQSSSEDDKKPAKQPEGSLTFKDGVFSLRVLQNGHTYELETNLQNRILQRMQQLAKGKQIKWACDHMSAQWIKGKNLIRQKPAAEPAPRQLKNSFEGSEQESSGD